MQLVTVTHGGSTSYGSIINYQGSVKLKKNARTDVTTAKTNGHAFKMGPRDHSMRLFNNTYTAPIPIMMHKGATDFYDGDSHSKFMRSDG